MGRRHRRIGRGLLAGIAGGLIASWVMNQFQALWSKASEELQGEEQPQPQEKPEFEAEVETEDATMKVADTISRTLLHRPLSKPQKKTGGPLVHYAFGSVIGGLYGVAAEMYPEVTRGFGTGFGATLFAVADEVAVPLFGLSGKPTEAPLSSHLYGLASHLVYGAATEGVRRAAKAAL